MQLRRVERLFAEYGGLDQRALALARGRARERALRVIEATAPTGEIAPGAVLVCASQMLIALANQLGASPTRSQSLLERLEEVDGLSRFALATQVFRAPELLVGPARPAIDAHLRMLALIAPLRRCSLWRTDPAGRAVCVHHAGDGGPSRGAQQLARTLLAPEGPSESGKRTGSLFGVRVVGGEGVPAAALIATARPGMRERSMPFVLESLPLLQALLSRECVISGSEEAQRALTEASERKLTRLGFDLHDGPIQDVALLADDLRLLGGQLRSLLDGDRERGLVAGRMEDLEGQLAALYASMRRLSSEAQTAAVLVQRPFAEVLERRISAFSARTQLKPRLSLRGDMSHMSVSQQIALLNIVTEALSNVREHADARTVEIVLSGSAAGVSVRISDDGRGFDVESVLARSAREGHVGLVAMKERVRLLGGRCSIESAVGRSTAITVELDRWLPVVEEPARSGD